MERIQPVIEDGPKAPKAEPQPSRGWATFLKRVTAGVRERLRFLAPFPELSFLSPEQRKLLGQLFPARLPSPLEQSPNVGNCYFVATLYALERHPIAPYIFAETVTKAPNGFIVNFLGDDESRQIFINDHSDLEGQEVPDTNKKGRKKYKQPLAGQLGDIVLERAFGRQRKEKRAQDVPHAKEMTMTAVASGFCEEPLKMLLGDRAEIIVITHNNNLLANNSWTRKEAEDLLMQFGMHPHRFVATACTPSNWPSKYFIDGDHREFGKGRKYFMDSECFFYQCHAFTVVAVDVAAKTVTLVDPHNAHQLRKTISFQDFFRYFSRVEAAELKETVEDHRTKKARALMRNQKYTANMLCDTLFPDRDFCVSRVTDSIFNIINPRGTYVGYSLMMSVDKFNNEVGGRVQLIKMDKKGNSWQGSIVWERCLEELLQV